jgi:hypothetical protein
MTRWVASLSACNDDPTCNTDLLGDAVAAYDKLSTQLSNRPLSFKFPLPLGGLQIENSHSPILNS